MKLPRLAFGLMHTDRIDATGYTRLILTKEHAYGRYVATAEWIPFDEPLPEAKSAASTSKTPFKFFDKTTGIPY